MGMAAKTATKAEIENKPKQKRRGNPAWVAGAESPNPGGRPLGTITALLRKKLDTDKFVDALLDMAYAKDLGAMREVYRRLEGEPLQRILLVREQAMALGRERGWQEDDIKRFAARAEELAAGTG